MGKSTNNNDDGRLVSALRVHLATRDRVESLGKLVAGALGRTSKADKDGSGAVKVHSVFAIQPSLGKQ